MQAFDVEVYVYDPTKSAEQIQKMGATKKELNKLLSECDVISLHAPSLPTTENMINKTNLALINPLRTFPNVICLPYVAGTYTNGMRAIGVHVCEEAERLIRGERMKCEVDLTKLNILA